MVSNIEAIVDRGERIELLIDKTESLNTSSVNFRQTSQTLQRKMWWQNAKMKVVLAVVGVVLLYFAVSAGCGGLLWPKCV